MLNQLREEIDHIDQRLIQLLVRRMAISQRIGVLKANLGALPMDVKRELAQQIKWEGWMRDCNCQSAILNVMQGIRAESRHIQSELQEFKEGIR